MVRVEAGQRVELRRVMRDGEETFKVTINWVEECDFGQYFGYTPDNWKYGKWGCARNEIEPAPYGTKVNRILEAGE